MSDLPFPEPDGPVPSIKPEQLRERVEQVKQTVTVVDARSPADYEAWHIDDPGVDSYNIPYFNFLDGIDDGSLAVLPVDTEIAVVCAKGKASEFVVERLRDHGYEAVGVEDGMRGWSQIYDRSEITAYDGTGTLYQYHRPSSGCLSYLLVSDGEAVVVDPLAAFVDRYHDDAAALDADLRYAVDTHVHADHVSGVRSLNDTETTGIVPTAAADRGMVDVDRLRTVEDGETVSVGAVSVEVLHAPGHTTGMTAYVVDGRAVLTGDGLFTESVARPDLEAGAEGANEAARTLYETLTERVLTLGADVIVAGGHTSGATDPAHDGTYTATIGALREQMPALSLDREAFVATVLEDMPPRPANYESIIATNLGKSPVDETRALELELGPNNCAASGDSMIGD